MAIIALIGAALSLTAFGLIKNAEERDRYAAAEQRAKTHASVIQGFIDQRLQQLRFGQALFEDALSVDPVQFNHLWREIGDDFSGVRAVLWLPWVRGDHRAAFEAAARREGSQGFQIRELQDGKSVPVPARDFYFPIRYVEPVRLAPDLLGFDIPSFKDRAPALRRAIETGRLAVSAGVPLVDSIDDGAPGVIAYLPVFFGGELLKPRILTGVVSAAYPIGEFLEAALKFLQPAGGLDIYFTERDDLGNEHLLYFHPSRIRGAPAAVRPLSQLRHGWFEEHTLRFGDRTWQAVFVPVPAAYPRQQVPAAAALGLGLVLTILLALYVHRTGTEHERVASLIVERTSELSQVNDELRDKVAHLRAAEHAVRDARARQQDFAEAASDLFWETNADFRFVWVSPRLADTMGFTPQSLIGRALWDWAGIESDQDPDWRLLRDTLRAWHPFRNCDCTVYDSDGNVRHMRLSGRPNFGDGQAPIGYRGTATDITEQVVMRRAAGREHRHLVRAMESVPDGVALFDAEDRLVFCNERYRLLFAHVADKIRPGVKFEVLLRSGAERGLVEEAAGRPDLWVEQRLAQRRAPAGPIEVYRNGRLIEIHDHRAPDGSTFEVLIDITDVRKKEEQLRQSQKLEAVGTFAGGIAHEFNNVLGIIRGYADLARAFTPADSPVVRHVDKIIKSVQRASAVTKSLLSFTRKRAPETKVVSLVQLVEDQSFLLKPLLRPTIDFQTNSADHPCYVRIDPDLFAQAIMNLAINARDAMPNGGSFRIAVDVVDAAADLPADRAPLGWVRMSLADNGLGMSRETIQRIFEPFFTTKAQGKGTGLGLSVVYGTVTDAGGSIKVDSEPGRGTTFTVYLPLTAAPAIEAATPADPLSEVRPARLVGRTVLLAEDEPMLRAVLGEAFAAARYRVLAAADGAEALELFDDNRIDILVTDVVMPEIDGLKLAALLTDVRPQLPVIYITGVPARGADRLAGFPPGAVVLFKPFAPADLVRAVDTAFLSAPSPIDEEFAT